MKNRYIKKDVNHSEYFVQEWSYELLKHLSRKKDTNINIHIPKVYNYNEKTRTLTMQKIDGDNLSDIYGEDINNVPIKLINIIRKFIYLLTLYSVEYSDITGYNFMLDKNENLWVIDFEHCICISDDEPINEFVAEFIEGKNSWNPEYE